VLQFFQWAGSSMVEQLPLKQRVGGSSPPRLTTFFCVPLLRRILI
jgi:hypothetical protein